MKIIYFLLPLLFIFHANAAGNDTVEFIDLGRFTQESIAHIISESENSPTNESKIKFISENFLDVPYLGHTLIGSNDKQEILTINLSGMDCFTYIDYVEAIRNSSGYGNFSDQVRNIRYKNGTVDYRARNHFFSDWPAYNSRYVKDFTKTIGGTDSVTVKKYLNLKKDGSNFLSGIPVVERNITYIPTDSLSPGVIAGIKTGDYIGIYSNIDGLDVSHTGIIIKKDGKAYIRHASSKKSNNKVLDEDLLLYMKNKPGLVIYRPV